MKTIIKGLEEYLNKLNFTEIHNEMMNYGIIGYSQSLCESFTKAKKAALSDGNILIQSESGTGKELFTKAIHRMSKRNNYNLVKINCAEIPDLLIESELFGYEKGAFTGAVKKKIGKIEIADKGTLFLDEISEINFSLQAKLLRLIEDKVFNRIGGIDNIPIDVRIIAATNKNLLEQIKLKLFREDLYYRIHVLFITIPPLRERREDIPLLLNYFINKYNKIEKKNVCEIDKKALDFLIAYSWPGNIRQLENVIHHALIMSENNIIKLNDLPDTVIDNRILNTHFQTESLLNNVIITETDLNNIEKNQIINALEKNNWVIISAAKMLGLHRNTLANKMKKYGIKKEFIAKT